MRGSIAIAVVTAGVLVAGCQADEVEIELATEHLVAGTQNGPVAVPFEAVFTGVGDMDDTVRAQMDQLEGVLPRYLEIDEFELESTDFGYEVTIEGTLPLTSDADAASPYFIHLGAASAFDGYRRVEVRQGRDYEAMATALTEINFMLASNPFHPTKFDLEGGGVDVIAPAVEHDGRAHLLLRTEARDDLRLAYRGGVYDSIGAGFYVRARD